MEPAEAGLGSRVRSKHGGHTGTPRWDKGRPCDSAVGGMPPPPEPPAVDVPSAEDAESGNLEGAEMGRVPLATHSAAASRVGAARVRHATGAGRAKCRAFCGLGSAPCAAAIAVPAAAPAAAATSAALAAMLWAASASAEATTLPTAVGDPDAVNEVGPPAPVGMGRAARDGADAADWNKPSASSARAADVREVAAAAVPPVAA